MKSVAWDKIVLAAGICAVALPLLADDASVTNTAAMAMAPADFAWDAALINLEEVRLGEAAQTNSQNADVQEFGKHMVRDHSRLNDRLVKIAQEEGLTLPDTNTFYMPVQPPAEKQATELMPETPQQKLLDAQVDVQNLVSLSGADFDQAYAGAMVKGHEKAMQKFEDASAALQDDKLKKYADRGLKVIRSHYDMAQKLESEVMTNGVASPMTNAAPNM